MTLAEPPPYRLLQKIWVQGKLNSIKTAGQLQSTNYKLNRQGECAAAATCLK
jgi:hypothetical protein